MKKHYPLLTLLFGLSVTTVAAPIQPQKAKQLAANFFGNSSKNNRAPLKISYQHKAMQLLAIVFTTLSIKATTKVSLLFQAIRVHAQSWLTLKKDI